MASEYPNCGSNRDEITAGRKLCFNHEHRLAVQLCEHCQKPLCELCVIATETKYKVCSFSCEDRLIALAQEEAEANRLPDATTRIWTSIFLVGFLTVLGSLAGAWLTFLVTAHPWLHRMRPDLLEAEAFSGRLLVGGAIGGIIGARTAIGFLREYYARKSAKRECAETASRSNG